MSRKFDLRERLIQFAVMIIQLVKTLPTDYTGRHFGNQLLRSGTSHAFHYGEALGAESQADFIHKMSICLKELKESEVNLEIIYRAKLTEGAILQEVREECDELVAIFVTSVGTAKRNKSRHNKRTR